MTGPSHLSVLQVRLSHERDYLARAKTEGERELRKVWVAQIEKEIASELKFTELFDVAGADDFTDDELLAALEE